MSRAFLSTLDAAELAELAPLWVTETVPDGSTLFVQGELADCGYRVRRGVLRLELTLPGEGRLHLADVGPGDFIGEAALLEECGRGASAVAMGDVEVDVLARVDFLGLRHSRRPAAFKVMREIAVLAARRLEQPELRRAEGDGGPAAAPAAPPLGSLEPPGCSFDPAPFLRRLPFFRSFSRVDLAALLALGELYEVSRGRELLRAGQPSCGCLAVVRGAVEVLGPGGERIALLGPGSLLGHLAPLLDAPVLTDCRVREDAVVLLLGPGALERLSTPTERLSYRFLDALCVDLLEALRQKSRSLARSEQLRRLARPAW